MKLCKSAILAALLATATMSSFAGKADDTLNWATDKEVALVDPYYNNARELLIMGHMGWDTLVLYNNASGEFDPLLAKSWKWKSNTIVEFDLREDVTFHDGSKLDADDVVYTINFVANKDNGIPMSFSWIKNATKLGQYKVSVELEAPYPNGMAYFANEVSIVPDKHYDKAPLGADGKKDYGQIKPMGSGPYKVSETKAGQYILWVKNDNYLKGGPKGTPSIGKIKFRSIKEGNTQLAELMTGGLDWIWDVPKEQALRLKDSGAVTVQNEKTLRNSYLSFDIHGNSGQKFFMDKRVRAAVAHAINRKSIAENLVGPASVVTHSACHPDQFGCTQDVTRWDYDPAKSKKLLAEAGYPNGFEFDLYAYREREFAEAVIGDLANVGIRAKLNYLQYSKLLEVVRQGKTPINMMTWGSSSIPDVAAILPQFFSGGPDDLAKDPRTAAAIQRGDSSVEPAERKKAYAEALQIISSELYWLPMFSYTKYYAFSKDLDFKPSSDEIPRFFSAKWK
jgi:peptide/nickel transport system substrate-binding protein